MEALNYLWCLAGRTSRVSLLSVPRVAAFRLRLAGAIPAKIGS